MRLLEDSLWLGKLIKARLNDILPVYPVMAAQGAPEVFCVYRRTSYMGRDTKDRADITETMGIQLTVVSPTHAGGLEKASAVNERIDHLRGPFEDILIDRMTLVNALEEWGSEAYLQHLYYEIAIQKREKR